MIETHSNYNSLEEEKAFKRLAVHMKRHTPDKSWMLQLLAVMDQTHEVFQKNYRPPSNREIVMAS